MQESEPPLDAFRANHLRWQYNLNNILKKYSSITETGIELDIDRQTFFVPTNLDNRTVAQQKKKFYAVNDNFGLAPISAPCNDDVSLDGQEQLRQKCERRDRQFRDNCLAVTPYLQPAVVPANDNGGDRVNMKIRETETVTTYSAEDTSIADLEELVLQNHPNGTIIERAQDGNISTIKILVRTTVQLINQKPPSQPLYMEDREIWNLGRANRDSWHVERRSSAQRPCEPVLAITASGEDSNIPKRSCTTAPSTSNSPASPVYRTRSAARRSKEEQQILAQIDDVFNNASNAPDESTTRSVIEDFSDSEEGSERSGPRERPISPGSPQSGSYLTAPEELAETQSQTDRAIDEAFANTTRSSLQNSSFADAPREESGPEDEVDGDDDNASGVQLPTLPLPPCSRKRSASMLVRLSPVSKKSRQMQAEQLATLEEEEEEVLVDKDEGFWQLEGSSLLRLYEEASEKDIGSLIGVSPGYFDMYSPYDKSLVDLWAEATVYWKENAPRIFQSAFTDFEGRQMMCMARQRNHRLVGGYSDEL